MRILYAIKNKILVTLLVCGLACGYAAAATSSARALEKGIQLYEQEKNEEAMNAFIEVLVNGNRNEVAEANRYINLIHSRIGGIQNPVEVDINFKEGELKHLQTAQDPAVQEQQLKAEMAPIDNTVAKDGLVATAQADAAAMTEQQAQELAAAQTALQQKQQALAQQQAREQALEMQNVPSVKEQEAALQVQPGASTFADLSSPSALRARQIYTSQKLQNMKEAVIARLENTKGVRLYFRNNLPDAIDIDSEVLFDGNKFRTEALPLLDDVYTLMALTQGAGYIILPPGSYTDNITLAGIRQAMALNSFFVHKGLSSGKISYNMGLFDQEPPAKFANLEGVSIVFDFEADLPSSLPEATSVNKLPMLSMAVVPVSNKIDPAAAEAFAIDFSVIETLNPIDTWLFQVVQHGADGSYYVVRQLEGFSPVYHQIVWNGRKGIIGPELACGQYTLVLTASDVQGAKRTIRRLVEVDCTAQKAAVAAAQAAPTKGASATKSKLNYKSARLWQKPGRVMKMPAAAEPSADMVDPFASDTMSNADAYAAGVAAAAPAAEQPVAQQDTAQGVSNPYEMPYEEYGN